MKKMLLTIAVFAATILGMATSVAAQTARPDDSVVFDYTEANRVTFSVTNFKVRLDGNIQPLIPVSAAETLADTPADARSYRFRLPAMTAGAHTVEVQACTANDVCSAPLTQGFNFEVIPDPVSNIRFRPTP